MKRHFGKTVSSIALASALFAAPALTFAQDSGKQEDNGIFYVGSFLLSVLHVPTKLVTCAWTQTTAAAFYVGTFGVKGHYDEDTNGRDIGETARLSCMGDWIITPDQVKKDYGK